MARDHYSELLAFVTVAREGSFTRAAAQLGVSQSALSHTVRGLEEKLGVRLLTRTTRSVSPTEAGERLMLSVGQRFEEIDAEVAAVTEARDRLAGTVRISSAEHAINSILWPKLSVAMKAYPDLRIEMTVDYVLSDIVAQRYDLGVRLGDQVAKDMIAVRIGPDLRMMVVGSPDYLARRARPQSPQDLAHHDCINLRLPTHGGLLAWDLEKDGHEIKVRVDGQWTFNSGSQILRAALAGCGLAYVPEDMAREHVEAGRLVSMLEAWCEPFPGYHLYYPSRRQSSRALGVVIDALRHRTDALADSRAMTAPAGRGTRKR